MGNNPFGIGEGNEKSNEDSFIQSLFYFMKEFGVNPFDEEFDVELIYEKVWWKLKRLKTVKLKKKGITAPMFNTMMKERNDHYKRENEANKAASRRR